MGDACSCELGAGELRSSIEAALGATARPANGLLDDVIDWHSPSDYRDQVAQLKTSADVLNLTAAGTPGWDAVYAEILAFVDRYKDVGWTDLPGEELWRAIQDRKTRVAEWAAKVRATGGEVYEPEHTEPPRGLFPDLGSAAPLLLAALAFFALRGR